MPLAQPSGVPAGAAVVSAALSRLLAHPSAGKDVRTPTGRAAHRFACRLARADADEECRRWAYEMAYRWAMRHWPNHTGTLPKPDREQP